jgi:hypothetical protein
MGGLVQPVEGLEGNVEADNAGGEQLVHGRLTSNKNREGQITHKMITIFISDLKFINR